MTKETPAPKTEEGVTLKFTKQEFTELFSYITEKLSFNAARPIVGFLEKAVVKKDK